MHRPPLRVVGNSSGTGNGVARERTSPVPVPPQPALSESASPADDLEATEALDDIRAHEAARGLVAGGPAGPDLLEMQSTLNLLDRARAGDEAARDIVFRRCVKGLRRFAAGRLPARCRGMNDTEDLVQDTVASALRRLDRFVIRHEGSLQAYLRQAVLNRVIDEVRKKNRRPDAVSLAENHVDGGLSPLEQVIGLQNLQRYEAALRQLRPRDQEAIVMRLEQQTGYDAMAEQLGMPSPNAARVAVKRALFRLARKMSEAVPGTPGANGNGADPAGPAGHSPAPRTPPDAVS